LHRLEGEQEIPGLPMRAARLARVEQRPQLGDRLVIERAAAVDGAKLGLMSRST
jgi:hypothetical protein